MALLCIRCAWHMPDGRAMAPPPTHLISAVRVRMLHGARRFLFAPRHGVIPVPVVNIDILLLVLQGAASGDRHASRRLPVQITAQFRRT